MIFPLSSVVQLNTSLFSVVENVNETTTNLNKDLENIKKMSATVKDIL